MESDVEARPSSGIVVSTYGRDAIGADPSSTGSVPASTEPSWLSLRVKKS
jgi:hypothetical protein